jgi:hypothetical protein
MNDTKSERMADGEAVFAEIARIRGPLFDKYKIAQAASRADPHNAVLAEAAGRARNKYNMSFPIGEDFDKIITRIRNKRIANREVDDTALNTDRQSLIDSYKVAKNIPNINKITGITDINNINNINKPITVFSDKYATKYADKRQGERGGRCYKSKKHRKLKGSRRSRRSRRSKRYRRR